MKMGLNSDLKKVFVYRQDSPHLNLWILFSTCLIKEKKFCSFVFFILLFFVLCLHVYNSSVVCIYVHLDDEMGLDVFQVHK